MMASGMCSWDYKPVISADVDITAPAYVKPIGESFGNLELSYNKGEPRISYYDDMQGGWGYLDEEQVRRLHSFLSQWLEKNSEDYF